MQRILVFQHRNQHLATTGKLPTVSSNIIWNKYSSSVSNKSWKQQENTTLSSNRQLIIYIDDRERNQNTTPPAERRIELTKITSSYGLLSTCGPHRIPKLSYMTSNYSCTKYNQLLTSNKVNSSCLEVEQNVGSTT